MRKNKISQKGFALLFSVLISSLLLTIGLSIFSVALKELAISTATRQSVHAFFAADSGREYYLYRDLKLGDLIAITDINDSEKNPKTTTGYVDGTTGPNYEVTMSKSWFDQTNQKVITYILAKGYDNDGDDKVERAIEQTY